MTFDRPRLTKSAILAAIVSVGFIVCGTTQVMAITAQLKVNKGVGVGFGQLSESTQTLTITLTAPDDWIIDESHPRDNSGEHLWNPPGGITTNSKSHTYTVTGIVPNDGHAVGFYGDLIKEEEGEEGTQPTFDAAVADLDIDVPGVDDAEEATESGGLYLPPSLHSGTDFPDNAPDNCKNLSVVLRPKWAGPPTSPEKVGDLTFDITGSGVALYKPDGTRLTAGVPIPPGTYTATYKILTNDNFTASAGITATFNWDSDLRGGPYTAVDDVRLAPIKVDKLQYEQPSGTWNDISETLYVLKGSTITFKAVPTPLVTWASGLPVWGGTSGATGTGETKAVTFDTLSTTTTDYKTVTATCGNTKTVNAIVYDLTGTLTPKDNFDNGNRSQVRLGLEEEVDLAFTTNPAGVTATQAGGLKWTRVGAGEVSNAGIDGYADYDAKHVAGAVVFYLTIQAGPCKDCYKSYGRVVIAPTGSYMTQMPNSGIRHTINTCSAGFLGWSYLEPKDVSFSNLKQREGTCTGTGTGFYAYLNDEVHPVGSWISVSPGNSSTGCRVLTDDHIYSGAQGSPYSTGQFDWPIPREYKADDGVAHQHATANHNQVADSVGKCTIQKHGAGPFSKNAGDQSSSW